MVSCSVCKKTRIASNNTTICKYCGKTVLHDKDHKNCYDNCCDKKKEEAGLL